MGYIGQGEDLFVSYCHGDPDGIGDSDLKVWTSALIRVLERTLRLMGRSYDSVSIFIDDELGRMDKLTETLRVKVTKTPLMLIVMTPRYLESGWCKDELEWFNQAEEARGEQPWLAAEAVRRRERGRRIFVARAMPTDTSLWPPCLKDTRGHTVLGFTFHPPPATNRFLPYGWPDLAQRPPEFNDELQVLITSIVSQLDELKDEAALYALAAGHYPRTAPAKSKIYLHPDTIGPSESWIEAKAVLEKEFVVLPDDLGECEETGRRRKHMLDADGMVVLRDDGSDEGKIRSLYMAQDECGTVQDFREWPLPAGILCPARLFDPAFTGLGIDQFVRDIPGWQAMLRPWLDHKLGRVGAAL